MPDTVAGDWGIEGFTSGGTVYQCYAPEEPLTTEQLYEKHRDKMTADLSKLRKNLGDIVSLVAPSEINCWAFLVPRVEDKEILRHAARKAEELRKMQLAGMSAAFVVRVHTAADFPTECRKLDASLAAEIPTIEVRSDAEIAQQIAEADLEVATLDGKLVRLLAQADESGLATLRAEFLRFYVVGRELEDWVRRHHPALWERWQHAREAIRRTLKTAELTTSAAPNDRLGSLLKDLESSASAAVPTMMTSDAASLAWGTVADWLIECPLDFAGIESG